MQGPAAGRIVLEDLFGVAQRPQTLQWEAFRPGVKIHRLYGNQTEGPSAALLWYEPGAGVPSHKHLGYEHILILSQSQQDDHGENRQGTLIINPPGSRHSIHVRSGAVVLVIWQQPVAFED